MANDNDIVELSISELIEALAEALKVVTRKPAFQKGDFVKLEGTVTGVERGHVNMVDTLGNSRAFPAAALQFNS